MLTSWPYWPVLTHRVLRRILPGVAVSSVGDGMGIVAVAWLALQLTPGPAQGLWVAAAVAAYSLPGVAGAVVLARPLAQRAGARLAGWNALLRALALGTVAATAGAGILTAPAYVALLAVSSLLNVWGSAGTYALVAQTLPDHQRLAGNALFSLLGTSGFIIGPALAGVVAGIGGPAVVIGADALTFAVLAASYLLVGRRMRPAAAGLADDGAGTSQRAAGPAAGPVNQERRSRPAGFRVIGSSSQLLGLTAITFLFFLLYGPVEIALPIHVHHDLHGSAALLGGFWTMFAIGEVGGGLLAAHLRRWPLWPVTAAIIVGWGACLLPAGAGGSAGLALAGFGVGGLVYAPFPSTSMTLFQRLVPPADLTAALAARGVISLGAPSVGEILGGPLVTAIGARHTLLFSAVATLVLGIATAVGTAVTGLRRRRSRRPSPASAAASSR